MLALIDAEVEEGGFKVNGIGQNHIEAPAVMTDHPFQQSFGRNHLPFPGPDHLQIQRRLNSRTDQMKNDGPMIMLDNLFPPDLHGVLAALRRNRKGAYRFLGIGGRGAEVRAAGVVMATELPFRVCEEPG
jgi:hypothetical protein